ncbi:MAG: hypothetical protein ACREDH_00465, partial [Methylocella sp.]
IACSSVWKDWKSSRMFMDAPFGSMRYHTQTLTNVKSKSVPFRISMRQFGVLLASAALGVVLVASGPEMASARGGGGGGPFGGFGGIHRGGFGPRFTGRSVAIGRFDHRFFDRDDRFRRFGRFDRDDRFFFRRGFRRGLFASGFPFWGYSYGDNGYSGYNYPSSNYSDLTGSAPLVIGASAPPGQPCIISVKACQQHSPPFVGDDCSCKVTGGATSEVP